MSDLSPFPIDLNSLSVTPPRKDGVLEESNAIKIWPLVETTFDLIEADEFTRDAARIAIRTSDGCVALANYLNSEAKRIHKMDYRFKVPLICLAAEMARKDDRTDSIYDPDEGAVYFETDEHQFSFHILKDWTIDWVSVADEVEKGYEWSGVENQNWALDMLLMYQEIDLKPYQEEPDDL